MITVLTKKRRWLGGMTLLAGLLLLPMAANASLDRARGGLQSAGEAAYGTGAAGGTAGLAGMIGSLIGAALGLIGVILVVLLIYGGFLWMTAAGNSDQVDRAKKIIINGVIGMIIVMSAYSISYFVVQRISSSTGLSGDPLPAETE